MCRGGNLGANKKYNLKVENVYGVDNNKYLIALLKKFQKEEIGYFSVTKEEYIRIKENKNDYEKMGNLYFQKGDYKRALEILEKVENKDELIKSRMAAIYMELEDYEKAENSIWKQCMKLKWNLVQYLLD